MSVIDEKDPQNPVRMYKSLRLYSGSANRPLAEQIAKILGVELSGLALEKFANGEIYARFDESVRGADVFFVQSISGDVNDALMELLMHHHRGYQPLRLRAPGPQGLPARAHYRAPRGQPHRARRR